MFAACLADATSLQNLAGALLPGVGHDCRRLCSRGCNCRTCQDRELLRARYRQISPIAASRQKATVNQADQTANELRSYRQWAWVSLSNLVEEATTAPHLMSPVPI